MTRQELGEQYDAKVQLYDDLRREAAYTIEHFLTKSQIKFHSVTSRLKSRERYLTKANRGDGVERIVNDLAGVRVVCLYLSDLQRVRAMLHGEFDVVSEDNKIDETAVDVFGYMSVHYVLQLPSSMAGPRYDELHGIVFEVQVRTILMDAWANVSHHLDYQGRASIPRELRRDFYALSGLFYVADTQFEMFAAASGRVASEERAAVSAGDVSVGVNRDTVSALIKAQFPNRKRARPKEFAEFADEMADIGFQRLQEVDDAIQAGLPEAKREDASREGNNFYSDIGMARVAISFSHPAYQAYLIETYENERNGDTAL